ncbi:MAG: C40 family peptidase [Rhodoferax sp.]|nr:C40 family peptidase [Actinomycetota bacterium]
MTTVRPHLSLPQLTRSQLSAGPVAKAGAVIAVSSGLVASLGMQATAAPATPQLAAAASTSGRSPLTSSVTSAFASGVPGALSASVGRRVAATTEQGVDAPQSPLVAQGQFGEIGFTATPAPKPKPVTVARVTTRPFAGVSRSANRSDVRVSAADVSSTDAGTSTNTSSNDAPSNDAPSNDAPSNDAPPATVASGAPGSAEFGAAVMAIAARYAGTAYRYGGTTPTGFDCSGFTSYVLRQVGIDLPRTSDSQRAATARISRSEAVPGDLVFMPGHVGIYAGDGMMWDSPRTGEVVSRRSIYSSSATYGRVG